MQNVCFKCAATKKFIFKIQDGGRLTRLTDPYHEKIFVDFQDGGCPSSWNFEIETFSRETFCVIKLNLVGETVELLQRYRMFLCLLFFN